MYKKKNCLFILGLLALVTSPTLLAFKKESRPSNEPSSWMSALPDDILLSEINLPGTHDSAAITTKFEKSYSPTGHGFLDHQNCSITEQLNHGIRLLDVRLKLKKFHSQKYFVTCHTALHFFFYNSLNEYQPFDDHSAELLSEENKTKRKSSLLEECRSFLAQHPSETIVMLLKIEDAQEFAISDFSPTLATLFEENQDLFYQPSAKITMPSLEKTRGKIYLLARFQPTPQPAVFISWKDNSYQKNAFNIGDVSFDVQDRYMHLDPNAEAVKTTSFINAIENYKKSDPAHTGLINFASGYNSFYQILDIKKHFLIYTLSLGSDTPLLLSWCLFDFPFDHYLKEDGTSINCVDTVIDSNFGYDANVCSPKNFD